MGLTSMTGFAREDGAFDALNWHWEMRAVNGKGLDVRCRLAQGFEALEPELREQFSKIIRRGSCQISFSMREGARDADIEINRQVLDKLVACAEGLSDNDKLAPARIDGLLGLRGVLQAADSRISLEDDEDLKAALLQSFGETLKSLAKARGAEGEKLTKVISGQLDEVQRLTQAAHDNPARAPEAIKQKLQDQISRLLEDTREMDQDRLHQEALLLAARVDVREELDRMFAHVEAARDLIKSKTPAGRKLDFLVQEMNREANTLCSKANDISVTNIGLELKAVIDQIKEQVQNIE